MLKLSEEEVHQTVQRASQIADQQAGALPSPAITEPYEPYLCAAEEVGIPRQAMLQALHERFRIPLETLQAGDLVFALSLDKAWYAATILRVENENSLRVQFLTGGEQRISIPDIRPFALVPGCEVQFDYAIVAPETGGVWHKAKILEYDASTQEARISYGLTSYTVPLTKLRLQAQKPRERSRIRPLLVRAILLAGSLGGAIGFLLGHYLRM